MDDFIEIIHDEDAHEEYEEEAECEVEDGPEQHDREQDHFAVAHVAIAEEVQPPCANGHMEEPAGSAGAHAHVQHAKAQAAADRVGVDVSTHHLHANGQDGAGECPAVMDAPAPSPGRMDGAASRPDQRMSGQGAEAGHTDAASPAPGHDPAAAELGEAAAGGAQGSGPPAAAVHRPHQPMKAEAAVGGIRADADAMAATTAALGDISAVDAEPEPSVSPAVDQAADTANAAAAAEAAAAGTLSDNNQAALAAAAGSLLLPGCSDLLPSDALAVAAAGIDLLLVGTEAAVTETAAAAALTDASDTAAVVAAAASARRPITAPPAVGGPRAPGAAAPLGVVFVDGDDAAAVRRSEAARLARPPRYFDDNDLLDPVANSRCFHCGNIGHRAGACTSAAREKPCYLCAQFGHDAKECPAQLCFACGRAGHISNRCPQRGSGRATSWEMNRGKCLRCATSACPCADKADYFRYEGGCTSAYLEADLKKCKCYVCGQYGHLCCKLTPKLPAMVVCYSCASTEHLGEVCPKERRAHLAAERSGDMRRAQQEREQMFERDRVAAERSRQGGPSGRGAPLFHDPYQLQQQQQQVGPRVPLHSPWLSDQPLLAAPLPPTGGFRYGPPFPGPLAGAASVPVFHSPPMLPARELPPRHPPPQQMYPQYVPRAGILIPGDWDDGLDRDQHPSKRQRVMPPHQQQQQPMPLPVMVSYGSAPVYQQAQQPFQPLPMQRLPPQQPYVFGQPHGGLPPGFAPGPVRLLPPSQAPSPYGQPQFAQYAQPGAWGQDGRGNLPPHLR